MKTYPWTIQNSSTQYFSAWCSQSHFSHTTFQYKFSKMSENNGFSLIFIGFHWFSCILSGNGEPVYWYVNGLHWTVWDVSECLGLSGDVYQPWYCHRLAMLWWFHEKCQHFDMASYFFTPTELFETCGRDSRGFLICFRTPFCIGSSHIWAHSGSSPDVSERWQQNGTFARVSKTTPKWDPSKCPILMQG